MKVSKKRQRSYKNRQKNSHCEHPATTRAKPCAAEATNKQIRITDGFGPPKRHPQRESEKHIETHSQTEGAKSTASETLGIA